MYVVRIVIYGHIPIPLSLLLLRNVIFVNALRVSSNTFLPSSCMTNAATALFAVGVGTREQRMIGGRARERGWLLGNEGTHIPAHFPLSVDR